MSFRKKLKILMISSSSSLGGGTKHMFTLGENINNNFKIFYAMPKSKNFSNYLNEENFVEISERKITFRDVYNLKEFIKLNSIDIIHAHGKGAGALSRIIKVLINKKLIYTFHGIHLQCHSWPKRLIYIVYEYLTGWLDSCKILVSNSERIYALQSKINLGKNFLIINNGVEDKPIKNNMNNFTETIKKKRLGNLSVISICRFVEQKNIKDILKIALKLPNLTFCIIGDGPLWDEINFLIKKNNLNNVNLLGEKKDIFRYLYESDIYLSTSLYEGLPISILEAMSIGLPIVASNVIGNCDTIENGKSGFLYKLNDTSNAVYYLQKLAKNFALRRKIGSAALKRQRNFFSKNSMISKYIDLYKNQI